MQCDKMTSNHPSAAILILLASLMTYFQFDREAQLLLCKHCWSALLPLQVNWHAKRKLKLSDVLLTILQDFVALLPMYTEHMIPLRSNGSVPVPDWPQYNGFQCCQYAFASRNNRHVWNHVQQTYKLKGTAITAYIITVWIQAWFSNNRARYWRVSIGQSSN